MKQIRSLAKIRRFKLKNLKNEMTKKIHTIKSINWSASTKTTWCGMELNNDDNSISWMYDTDYLIRLQSRALPQNRAIEACSCCDNVIQRAIRQRILGI